MNKPHFPECERMWDREWAESACLLCVCQESQSARRKPVCAGVARALLPASTRPFYKQQHKQKQKQKQQSTASFFQSPLFYTNTQIIN